MGDAAVSSWSRSLTEAASALATGGAETAHYLLRHGSMKAGVYKPILIDGQEPHSQDELYIIISGSGVFVKGSQSVSVSAGDVLFVEAHSEHRFYEFTQDFATWVVFWGPPGGEPDAGE